MDFHSRSLLLPARWCWCFLLSFRLTFGQFDPYFSTDGSSGTIVHLLEWTFADVEAECERYLGPNGVGGVQLSPVNEVRVLPNRSWRERYEPVSYRIAGRSGDEVQFRSMVRACNEAGVRVYVEVVLNHMAGGGASVKGTGGSIAYPDKRDYPSVPYGAADFNDACSIENESDAHEVRICQLEDRPDLNLGLGRVRQRMIDFLNKLISMGVAGFYIHAAKNMWPHDLRAIYTVLENLSSAAGFPPGSRPFIYHDVQDVRKNGSTITEYTLMGMATEYRFAFEIADIVFMRKPLHYMVNLGTRLGYIPRERSVVFLDNSALQRLSHDEATPLIVTFKSVRLYKIAMVFMLAHRYGTPLITSSYDFKDSDDGPPADTRGRISAVTFDEDDQCTGGWICEHRWNVVKQMVRFRKEVSGQPVISWVDNGQNQVAFCRGKKGFVAFNDEIAISLKANLFTCLEAGTYCDIVSGKLEGGKCTGTAVVVEENGRADIFIQSNSEEPFIVLLASEKV